MIADSVTVIRLTNRNPSVVSIGRRSVAPTAKMVA